MDLNNPDIYASYTIDDLVDLMNEKAPPYMFFGSVDNHDENFMYFVDHDQIEHDLHDGELVKINDTAELSTCNTSCGALHVNDHGNITLYLHNGDEWEEVWARV